MDGEPQRAEWQRDRFLTHRGLIAVCSGTAMAEALLLVLFAPAARGFTWFACGAQELKVWIVTVKTVQAIEVGNASTPDVDSRVAGPYKR